METARNAYSALCRFCQSVVEWRSPATGPYLLAVNSLFWLSAFYCEHLLQMRMLVSIAVGVMSWDILLSSSNDHNIATHIVMWPVRSLFRTSAVGLSLYSWNLLRLEHIEPACWAAYGTVGCLLVNPVWSANHVNDKLLDCAKYVGTGVRNGVHRFIVTPIKTVFSVIVYVVTFEWVSPLWNLFKGGLGNAWRTIVSSVKNFFIGVKEWWIGYVVEPVCQTLSSVGRWLRYWFCAHWWPDLKAWMALHIGEPCKRAFNYVCFCLVYVFCGHWIPPLAQWLKKHLDTFLAFLYRTVVQPTKLWLMAKFEEFRCWLRAQLHRLAVAIRDSVLWPVCVLVVDCAREISLLIYRTTIKPVLDYFYQRYKIIETAVLIYILGPICKVFINNIPEKNPFCDESDVELEGMLPDEISDADEQVVMRDYPNESDLLPSSPLDEEEKDFVAGLDFPDVDASESSDDEFDLKKPKRNIRQRRKQPQPVAGGYDDTFEELRSEGERHGGFWAHPIVKRIRGWSFAFFHLFSSFFGAIYIITPLLPLIVIRPRLWRWIMDRLIGMWVIMPGALMEYLFRTKITIGGDMIDPDQPALIIMNHRTRLDWLFFWNALYKMNPWLCTTEKISMKGVLKFIPGAGWAMGSNAFLFLDRQFELDKPKLDSMIDYYSRTGYSYQLLFFPEGTDKCSRATERARLYAEKKGLRHYEQVLHPRTTGFIHIMKTMRQVNYIRYIYDVTIAFPENIVQTESDLIIRGDSPTSVQYHVRKIPVEDLPEEDEALSKWLTELWRQKEEKLKKYYSLPIERRSFDECENYELTLNSRLMQIFLIGIWIFTTIFWIVAFLEVHFMLYFAMLSVVIYLFIGITFGGIEWLAVRCLKS